jgi:hypothetical protein
MTNTKNDEPQYFQDIIDVLAPVLDQGKDVSVWRYTFVFVSRTLFSSTPNIIFSFFLGLACFFALISTILGNKSLVFQVLVIIPSAISMLGFSAWNVIDVSLAELKQRKKRKKLSERLIKRIPESERISSQKVFGQIITKEQEDKIFEDLAQRKLYELEWSKQKLEDHKKPFTRNKQYANSIFPVILNLGLLVTVGGLSNLPVISGLLIIFFVSYNYDNEKFSPSARIDKCICILRKAILRKRTIKMIRSSQA